MWDAVMDPTLKAPFVQGPRKRSPRPTRHELFVAYCSYFFPSPAPGSPRPTRQELFVAYCSYSFPSPPPGSPRRTRQELFVAYCSRTTIGFTFNNLDNGVLHRQYDSISLTTTQDDTIRFNGTHYETVRPTTSR